ncbi:hypothetical protein [Cupriavidus consociatus]|uniref:hypothetical protein n=1 Tax=Cupriavidus consociatus TaxID=2821357 RepID=UPI001AEB99A6|nr:MULTISPECIES: hypothetical protein [unclassified Cupriavidus]MBP0623187.1 hypothetical protein [Cupriavidus sp. LEh25]MDK2659881.1 hypothetical protein [Cupriavidus sp. LEh21]
MKNRLSIQAWFATQMVRMGDDLDPDMSLDVKTVIRSYLAAENAAARCRRLDSEAPAIQSLI